MLGPKASCSNLPRWDSAHTALLRAYAAEGNISEALLVDERFEERMADELGMAPSVELESLIRRLIADRAVRARQTISASAPGSPQPEAISCRVGDGDLEFE